MKAFLKVFLCAFILAECVLAKNVQTEESDLKKRAAAKPVALDVAEDIDKNILATGWNPKTQIGFLYLHDSESRCPTYNNAAVRDSLVYKRRLPNLNPFWPNDPRTSNCLIAVPSRPGQGEKDNTGHSEFKLLQQLGQMTQAFRASKKECPTYVIIGSKYSPCNSFRPLGDKPDRCAQTIIRAKNGFPSECSSTQFVVFVREPTGDRKPWSEVQRIFNTQGIEIYRKN